MAQEVKKSVERIKQEIEFYKENLKFLNSFYLPLLSALAVLSVSHDGNTYKDGSLFMVLYALGFLTLIKMDTLFTIKSLIKQL